MDANFFSLLKALKVYDILQRSAVRNAKSILFVWTGFRCSLVALEEVVPRRVATSSMCARGAKGNARGAHPTLVQEDPLLSNVSLGCGLLQVEGTRETSARKGQK